MSRRLSSLLLVALITLYFFSNSIARRIPRKRRFMNLIRIFFVVGLMLVISDAFGQSSVLANDPDVTVLSWEPPTTRQNGQALDPATELAEYRLYCGEIVTVLPSSASGQSYEVASSKILPGYGQHQCSITAVDTDGRESQKSKAVAVTWEQSPPSAPLRFLVIRAGN